MKVYFMGYDPLADETTDPEGCYTGETYLDVVRKLQKDNRFEEHLPLQEFLDAFEIRKTRPSELCARSGIAVGSSTGTFDDDAAVPERFDERRSEKTECGNDYICIDITENSSSADHVVGEASGIPGVLAGLQYFGMQHEGSPDRPDRSRYCASRRQGPIRWTVRRLTDGHLSW
jgi:hypothetical protein